MTRLSKRYGFLYFKNDEDAEKLICIIKLNITTILEDNTVEIDGRDVIFEKAKRV